MNEIERREDALFKHVTDLIEQSRQHVKKAVDTTMVYTYYGIGKYIVEDEQEGKKYAQYGKSVLQRLSDKLTIQFGNGWSVDTLEKARKFYSLYSKSATLSRNSGKDISTKPKLISSETNKSATPLRNFVLSWSHYLVLMRIKNDDERSFYEIECAKQNWSVRQLQRQYNSSLYERLALSRDKDEVMRLAKEGQTVEKPSDVIKNPITLEFLGLKPEAAYSESKLESAIIP